jgi:hypothetical protein
MGRKRRSKQASMMMRRQAEKRPTPIQRAIMDQCADELSWWQGQSIPDVEPYDEMVGINVEGYADAGIVGRKTFE